MDLLFFNLSWMFINVLLALLPVFLGLLMLQVKNPIVKFIVAFSWFVFLPNSIYLLTDMVDFFIFLYKVEGIYLIANLLLYIGLIPIGIVTYIISIYAFEKLIYKNKFLKNINVVVFVLNIFVGFGLVLGRIQRVNSWEVISDPQNVILKSFAVFKTPEILGWFLLFTIACEIIYLVFRKKVLNLFKLK